MVINFIVRDVVELLMDHARDNNAARAYDRGERPKSAIGESGLAK
jgi:hypothetical protein